MMLHASRSGSSILERSPHARHSSPPLRRKCDPMQPKKPGGFDEPPFMPPLDQCLRCGHWMDADRLELHQRTCNVDPVARVEQEKRLDRNREERIVREREEERLRELEREREWAQVEREREKMEKREREREQLERERIEERQGGAAEDKARAEELLAQE